MVRNIRQSANDRAIQCVTEDELQQAGARLRPADLGVVHPGLPYIRARRTPDRPQLFITTRCPTSAGLSMRC